jgi:hypothetical protein
MSFGVFDMTSGSAHTTCAWYKNLYKLRCQKLQTT